MCGRVVVYSPADVLAEHFHAAEAPGLRDRYEPSHNLAPSRQLVGLSRPVVGGRVLDAYRWGLVPSWARDPSVGSRLFNARAETVATRGAFGKALGARRLAVVVDGFYEWGPGRAGRRVPSYFSRADGAPLVFAGLWESWRSRDHPRAAPLTSCTIITTTASGDLDGVHQRMPVILETDALDVWLERRPLDPAGLDELLRPAPDGTLVHHRVDPRVGDVRHDRADLPAPYHADDAPEPGAPEALRLFG